MTPTLNRATSRRRPTCVVLGANGFIGSAIVTEIQRRGFPVIPVTRKNYAGLRGTECDLLINANGNSKKYLATRQPAKEFDLSVRSVMRSLRDFKTRRYLHLSTIDVYADHSVPELNREDAPDHMAALSSYGLHKRMAELLVMKYAPAWTILRIGGCVGPGLKKNSVYDLLTGAPVRVHPDSTYQYLDTRDLSRLALRFALSPNTTDEIINVCGDGIISVRDIAVWLGRENALITAEALPMEHYEVNLDKLRRFVTPPSTPATARRFLRDLRSGKIQIASQK